MDFSNHLFHCSTLGLIMTDNREKSNLEKYNYMVQKRDDIFEKFSKIEEDIATMKNTETKTFSKKMDTLENYTRKLDELNRNVDELYRIKDVFSLSDTCKSHLMDIFVSYKYGRTKDIKLKYWEKGLMNEEQSIDIYSFATNTYLEKNKVRKSNTYLTGEIDVPVKVEDFVVIYDMKTSWDLYTFWRSLAKGVTYMEFWQLQGYCWLWDLPKAKICKVLTDTPDVLIENEKRALLRDFIGSTEDYEEACKEIERLHKYSDIPNEERIIELEVERDDEFIERIPQRVEQCRDYLNNIKPGTYYEMERE
jgi:hypothetical protein